jgi:hypothetical protein
MRTRLLVVCSGILAVVLGIATANVHAQTIGTFTWRLSPHCNVVTLSVEQRGSTYVLTGYDDHCGAPVRGAVSGTAHFNPDGSLGMGFTVLRPDGRAIPTSATLSLATVSGTWADAYGNSGDFVFNPPGSAGEPRRITLKGSYAIQFQPTAGGQNGTATISFGEALDAEPTAVTANFITGSASTTDCPGTAANPQAAPGHLCIYERAAQNVTNRCMMRTGATYNVCGTADPFGTSVLVRSLGAGAAASVGAWAVTIP